MDATQIVDHAISLLFGGAGGVVAGIARLSAIIRDLKKTNEELERRQTSVEHKIERLRANHGELSRRVDELRDTQSTQYAEVRRLVTTQAEVSYSMLNEKIDVMREDVTGLSGAITDLQRAIGTVEGTLSMLVRTNNDRGSSPTLETYVDPPVSAYRNSSNRSPR